MKVIVVGLGIQGRKRLAVAGPDAVGSVGPVAAAATWRDVREVPLDAYDAALVCTPDGPKVELLTYLLGHGKHVLVEKPLIAASGAELEGLKALAADLGSHMRDLCLFFGRRAAQLRQFGYKGQFIVPLPIPRIL